jgi:hypothetical protein
VPGGYSWAESVLIGIGMLGRAGVFFKKKIEKNLFFFAESVLIGIGMLGRARVLY